DFIFDARQLISRLGAFRPLLHEALLELVADRIFRRVVGRRRCGRCSGCAGRSWNAGGIGRRLLWGGRWYVGWLPVDRFARNRGRPLFLIAAAERPPA